MGPNYEKNLRTKSAKQINITNKSYTLLPNQEYDIRRVIKKSSANGIEIDVGNNEYVSDVLNVYVDGDEFGYVASNSLCSHP